VHPPPPLAVLAFLPPPLLAHLRVVLQPSHTLTAYDDWALFEQAVREATWDAVVADPQTEGALRTDDLAALIEAYPSTPLTLYTCVSATTLKSIAELARFGGGAHPIVLHRYDDEPRRFLELLERQPANALSAALLRQLEPGLDLVAPKLARAIEHLIRRPTVFLTAADLAATADLTVRTVYRQLAAAGFESPRTLIVGARLLRAYAYARDPGQSLESVASRVGYSAPRMLTRHMREIVGVTPRCARRKISAEEFVSTLAGRLYASPRGATFEAWRSPGPARPAARAQSRAS
jgi:AraC-like DNA-binding protein